MDTKTCSKCKQLQPLTSFSRDSSKIDGLRPSCKTCHNKLAKEHYYNNKDQYKKKNKNYYNNNKDKINCRARRWRKNNIERVRHCYRTWKFNKYHDDINFKLAECLRSRLNSAIKTNAKSGSAVNNLGCSIQECKQHLEKLFQPGMTWDNWTSSGWHIDHIKPLSSFDLTDYTQLQIACHYTNLQPMWAKENQSKGNKL